jgi:DNA-binding NarL/FixJ family response regulator
MKILLADDHWIIRESIKRAVQSIKEQPEILEAASFDEALTLLGQHSDIDLLLTDLMMPGFTEFEGLRVLRLRHPDVPVAIISVHEERDQVMRAIEEGVVGYIPKSASGEDVLRALQLLLDGNVAFPRHILQSRSAGPAFAKSKMDTTANSGELTPREMEVFQLASASYSNERIARSLNLSPNTVRVHLRNLSAKLSQVERERLKQTNSERQDQD